MKRIVACFLVLFLLACGTNTATDPMPENSSAAAELPDTAAQELTADTVNQQPWADSIYAFAEYKDDHQLFGFITGDGREVLAPQFDLVGDVYKNRAPVIKGDKHGICDTTGKFVCVFDGFEFAIWNNELSGQDQFESGTEGFYAVTNETGKLAFVNSRGQLITDFIYDDVSSFSEGKAVVFIQEKAGFIDTNGTEVIRCQYEHAWPFSEGLAAVRTDGKTGFIDHSGAFVIDAIYQEAFYFNEGLCPVTKSAEYTDYYYIDQTGKTILPGPYVNAGEFQDGKAYVFKRGTCRIIDKTGKELEKLDYDCFGGC